MNHVQHPSNNAVLGAPAGWDQKELPCNSLSITRTECDGMPVVVSYWRPTAEELVALNAGAPLALMVVGHTMAPVSLSVEP